MATEQYVYRPLETDTTIRVLVLQPAASFQAPLCAKLIHVDRTQLLREPEQGPLNHYDCISYCWGEPVFTHAIDCDGFTCQITDRVDSMLRHLRKRTAARNLWLDAICLNQKNTEEKGVQVQLMGEIYRYARKVHVWLGTAMPEDHIQKLFVLFKILSTRTRGVLGPFHIQEVILQVFPNIKVGSNTLRRFFSRPWFQRRWVVQEICRGPDAVVRCGSYKLPWQSMARAILAFITDGLSLDEVLQCAYNTVSAVERWRGTFSYIGRLPDMLVLLHENHRAQCSDPRDRLFALRGLSRENADVSRVLDEERTTLPVDYEKPWTQIYQDFAKECIDKDSDLTILYQAFLFGSLAEVDDTLPSWVPNWSRSMVLPHHWLPPASPDYVGFSTVAMSDGRLVLVMMSRAPRTYRLLGLASAGPFKSQYKEVTSLLRTIEKSRTPAAAPPVSEKSTFNPKTIPNKRRMALQGKRQTRHRRVDRNRELEIPPARVLRGIYPEGKFFLVSSFDERYPRMGIGPITMQKEDQVLVCDTSTYPYSDRDERHPIIVCLILRPRRNRYKEETGVEKLFEFVGMGLVCGFLDGEAKEGKPVGFFVC